MIIVESIEENNSLIGLKTTENKSSEYPVSYDISLNDDFLTNFETGLDIMKLTMIERMLLYNNMTREYRNTCLKPLLDILETKTTQNEYRIEFEKLPEQQFNGDHITEQYYSLAKCITSYKYAYTKIKDLYKFPYLNIVDISGSNILDKYIKNLNCITFLFCNNCQNITNDSICTLTNLRCLDCSYCSNISDISIKTLSHLIELHCSSCKQITDNSISKKINIQFLNCSYCPSITNKSIKKLSEIYKLNCSYTNVNYTGIKEYKSTQDISFKLIKLSVLECYECDMTNIDKLDNFNKVQINTGNKVTSTDYIHARNVVNNDYSIFKYYKK